MESRKSAGEWLDPYVAEFADRLVQYVQTRTKDVEAARDITQETFLRLYRHHLRYPSAHLHAGWLYTVAHRLAIDWQRRNEAAYRKAKGVDEAGAAPDTDLWLSVEAQLARMAARDREILLLFYYQEWTSEEIGRELGIPAATVRTRLHRARDAFRRMWEGSQHG